MAEPSPHAHKFTPASSKFFAPHGGNVGEADKGGRLRVARVAERAAYPGFVGPSPAGEEKVNLKRRPCKPAPSALRKGRPPLA